MTRRRNRPTNVPTLPITNVPSTEIVPPSTDTDARAYERAYERALKAEHAAVERVRDGMSSDHPTVVAAWAAAGRTNLVLAALQAARDAARTAGGVASASDCASCQHDA